MSEKALDRQEGGNHYKDLAIQPVEYIHRNGIGYCEGSVIKYVTRWRNKNGVEDLRKARHFLDLLIEMETREQPDFDMVHQVPPCAHFAGSPVQQKWGPWLNHNGNGVPAGVWEQRVEVRLRNGGLHHGLGNSFFWTYTPESRTEFDIIEYRLADA